MNELVMIVEDDVDQSAILRTILEAARCHVIDVEDGDEALDRLQTEEPDLIVLDLEMPRLSGMRFLEERAGRGLAPRADVLVCSASILARTPDDCYRINKPFRLESFRWLVESILGRHRGLHAPATKAEKNFLQQCACGREYNFAKWNALLHVRSSSGGGGHGSENRRCRCGSTLSWRAGVDPAV